uniref:CTCHY-type domain-containing protein n=1 Tax=Trichuris muris TaxID=70415 RepID=A0A5S6Q2B2_TRIMR
MTTKSGKKKIPIRPRCIHGPCLLFSRFRKGARIRYYACSAYRDRKDCSFYWPADKAFPLDKARQIRRMAAGKNRASRFDSNRLSEIRMLNAKSRAFCFDCCCLVLPKETDAHNSHRLRKRITNRQLDRPSSWLPPIWNRHGEAQYWFTDETTHFLAKTVNKFSVDGVLCIGTPRLHELLHIDGKKRSFLLDIDERYEQFFKPSDFARFNLFACYFFTQKGKRHCKQFLESCQRLVIVIDPPFGGLAKVIGKTLQTVMRMHKRAHQSPNVACDLLWMFPYFLERKVTAIMPRLSMLDYQVEYDNHVHFNSASNRRPSPIRIFTSLDPGSVPLPVHEGKYRFCNICKRFVAAENRHCQICHSCTSKNGRPYVHCFHCGKCVKATNIHCEACSTCHRKGSCAAEDDTQDSH